MGRLKNIVTSLQQWSSNPKAFPRYTKSISIRSKIRLRRLLQFHQVPRALEIPIPVDPTKSIRGKSWSQEGGTKAVRTSTACQPFCFFLFLPTEFQNFPLLIPPPRCLDKASRPSPPLLRVKTEGVLNLPTVEPPELTRHKFQLLSYQGKCLHFR